jgi:hypothetical protein
MVEKEELRVFLEVYEVVTGDHLEHVATSERPDFVCMRPDGTLVGVELTKIMRDPESATWDKIMKYQEFRDAMDANDNIWSTAEYKSRKLKAGNWQHAENTILVLQVMDCPLSDLHRYLEDGSSPQDYADLGFVEIWVADYSELEAYGTIELFGLYPQEFWGYHELDRGKPYG